MWPSDFDYYASVEGEVKSAASRNSNHNPY